MNRMQWAKKTISRYCPFKENSPCCWSWWWRRPPPCHAQFGQSCARSSRCRPACRSWSRAGCWGSPCPCSPRRLPLKNQRILKCIMWRCNLTFLLSPRFLSHCCAACLQRFPFLETGPCSSYGSESAYIHRTYPIHPPAVKYCTGHESRSTISEFRSRGCSNLSLKSWNTR